MVKTLKEFRTILLGQQFKTFTDHKNLTCKNFNTNHLLWWRPILEEHSPEIEYIPVKKNIVEVALSWLPNNGNQETTHESTYTMEAMSQLYDVNELPYGMLPLSFKPIDQYQQKGPILPEKLKCVTNQKDYFIRGWNIIELVTFKDKIVIP